MELHLDLLLVNSLRRDLMCCSAATQTEIPPTLSGASSFLFLCACVSYIHAMRVVLYLWESDYPQRVWAVTLAKQRSVYPWPGDLYAMWPDASLQAPGPTPAMPRPSFSSLPRGTVHRSAPASHTQVWIPAQVLSVHHQTSQQAWSYDSHKM